LRPEKYQCSLPGCASFKYTIDAVTGALIPYCVECQALIDTP
jgi:hypothetical protein